MDSDGKRVDVEDAKVLQPPGGATSNIFGNGPEIIDRKASEPENNHLQSDVSSATDSPSPAPQSTATNKGTEKHTETPERKTTKGGRQGFNPITGQDYDDNASSKQQRQQQTAKEGNALSQSNATPVSLVRVRQPPGGTSSKLW